MTIRVGLNLRNVSRLQRRSRRARRYRRRNSPPSTAPRRPTCSRSSRICAARVSATFKRARSSSAPRHRGAGREGVQHLARIVPARRRGGLREPEAGLRSDLAGRDRERRARPYQRGEDDRSSARHRQAVSCLITARRPDSACPRSTRPTFRRSTTPARRHGSRDDRRRDRRRQRLRSDDRPAVRRTVQGLPQVPVTVVPVGLPSTDTAGSDEWDLDTQSSTGMAQNVRCSTSTTRPR